MFIFQGWVTLQLTRNPAFSRGFLSARSVTGFLSDVYPAAADEVGKIYVIADERVCIYNMMCLFILSVSVHVAWFLTSFLTTLISGSRGRF